MKACSTSLMQSQRPIRPRAGVKGLTPWVGGWRRSARPLYVNLTQSFLTLEPTLRVVGPESFERSTIVGADRNRSSYPNPPSMQAIHPFDSKGPDPGSNHTYVQGIFAAA